jgi:hypothetical protein
MIPSDGTCQSQHDNRDQAHSRHSSLLVVMLMLNRAAIYFEFVKIEVLD